MGLDHGLLFIMSPLLKFRQPNPGLVRQDLHSRGKIHLLHQLDEFKNIATRITGEAVTDAFFRAHHKTGTAVVMKRAKAL